MEDLKVGDIVIAHEPGSWVDNKRFIILVMNYTSVDNIKGAALSYTGLRGGWTVVPISCLEKCNE